MTTLQMTAAPNPAPRVPIPAPLRQLGGLIGTALSRLARRLAASVTAWATIKALRQLSDHQLRDIGVERGQIRAAARSSAHALHGLR